VYFSAYHISKQNAQNYLEGIKKYGIEYMTGYAVSNYLLAQLFKEMNAEVPPMKALYIQRKADCGNAADFCRVIPCKTFDGWGSVESCGLVTNANGAACI
jgi:phenylacetate-CoA ligase